MFGNSMKLTAFKIFVFIMPLLMLLGTSHSVAQSSPATAPMTKKNSR